MVDSRDQERARWGINIDFTYMFAGYDVGKRGAHLLSRQPTSAELESTALREG
jgi:hypothetical protein